MKVEQFYNVCALWVLLIAFMVVSCDNDDEPPRRQVNEDIVLVQNCCSDDPMSVGTLEMGVWVDQSTVHTTGGLYYFEIDDQFKAVI